MWSLVATGMPAAGRIAAAASIGLALWAAAPAQDSPDIALTVEQSNRLAEYGWPPSLPVARAPDHDFLQRRGGTPVSGNLQSLHAFALVDSPSGKTRVSREEIGFILLDGELIPRAAPPLPLDEDAVLLIDGETLLTGRVEVEGEAIYVAGRIVRQSEAALIRLRDPATVDEDDQGGAPGPEPEAPAPPPTANGSSAESAGGARGSTAASVGSSASGSHAAGPDEIPWGQAVWRGSVQFEAVTSSLPTAESGSYAITLSEERIGTDTLAMSVTLRPEFLAYRYSRTVPGDRSCPGFTITAQGVGFDAPGAALGDHSQGYLFLAFNAGQYGLVILPPAYSDADACKEAPTSPEGYPLPSLSVSSSGYVGMRAECESQAAPAAPPYFTIVGQTTCGAPGEYGYFSGRWQFDRGAPGADPTIDQDACAGPRAQLENARDARQRVLDRLRQISNEFGPLAAREASQRMTKDQLQWAFNLMLAAGLSADIGKRLLELVTSDGMLKAAAATGQITAAQLQFISRLNQAIDFYQQWLEFADDPGGWGSSQLLGGGQDVAFGDGNRLGDFALDMFAYGQLLGDLVGQSDGSETLAYIEDHLSGFGPLIPDYALGKARQYVEASRAWAETIGEMSRLTNEAGRLTYEAEELALQIDVREEQLDGC